MTAVSQSDTVLDHQLTDATSTDGGRLKQCTVTSQPRPDVKLTVINVETQDDVELVECQLETAKHFSVSFKFSHFTDQPNDVAASLVNLITLVV